MRGNWATPPWPTPSALCMSGADLRVHNLIQPGACALLLLAGCRKAVGNFNASLSTLSAPMAKSPPLRATLEASQPHLFALGHLGRVLERGAWPQATPRLF